MKKLFILLTIVSFNIRARDLFEFVDNKTNGALDKQFIQKIVDTFKVDTFFETGTYTADTTINAVPFFKSVFTVELHEELFKAAQLRLAPYKSVHIYHGKSPDIIKAVGPSLDGTVLFWLDAHYSGEGTALSFNNPNASHAVTAIREELAAIKEINIKDCVILIDDIRGFGTEIAGVEYLGCWAYPTLQEVESALRIINPDFECALLGDMLLAYDKFKYQPTFSETVKACTKTRLYNGYNVTDQELLVLEEKIRNAPRHEKEYIKTLYNRMTDYKDPMFWHDLWYGLVALGEKNYAQARTAFMKVKVRNQYFNKDRQSDSKVIAYDHWRIDHYLQACN